MIHIDLSRTPPLRPLIYLLALFPGIFFLSSIAVGNPALAQAAIAQFKQVYPFPPYGIAIIMLGSAFVIGQAFIVLTWMVAMLLRNIYRLPRFLLTRALKKVFSHRVFVERYARFQGNPPRHPRIARTFGKLMAFAIDMPAPPQESAAAWDCLVAATETLLKRRYGIEPLRASGSHPGTWDVWCSVLGKPVQGLVESLNLGRVMLACGISGFFALRLAPRLEEGYFLSLCSIFAFSGLWTAGAYFFKQRNPTWHNAIRLRAVLLELQEWSNTESLRSRDQNDNARTAGRD